MSRVPRASLSITLLDDEDYRVLMASKGGLEAFGLFVAMIVVGRERLQQGQARQLSNGEVAAQNADPRNPENANLLQSSMSDSLRFDNSTTHILTMTHATPRQLDRCLNVLNAVANETSSEPWMYLDKTKHLVIRSFFKFNTNTGWGGERQGAGRKSRRNQDESAGNQLDTESDSSWCASGTGTGTGTNALDAPARAPARAREGGAAPPEHHGSHQEAVEVALDLFGEAAANSIAVGRESIESAILGTDDRPRWDCYVAALRHADEYRRKKGRIHTLNGFCIDRVREWVAVGRPAPTVSVDPDPEPAAACWEPKAVY